MGSLAIARLSILETLRRKEFYIVFVFIAVLAIWMYSLNMTSSGAGRFAKDIVMQVVWLASFALTVPLAARQISADVEQKSIYVLMARPIHRWQYVVGRAVGAITASAICFTSMFAVLILMLAVKGAGSLADASLWQAYLLQVMALITLASLTLCLSTVSSPGGAITFALLMLCATRYGSAAIMNRVQQMPEASRDVAWGAYLLIPHFEFFNVSQRVVHGWGPLPTSLFVQAMAYGLICSIFFVALAAAVFRKRWL